jgi:P-type Cu+ transporter
MSKQVTPSALTTQCFHCGDACANGLEYDDHLFCCQGCKSVYLLLSQNQLCGYYDLEHTPGINRQAPISQQTYAYLDDHKVASQILNYQDETIAKAIFFIPTMHCSSCIWLLEHLYKLNPHITYARVQFLKKELHVSYDPKQTNLREVVTLLSSIGYEPSISLQHLEKRVQVDSNKRLSYQIGVAGFCFGNIMLVSFPEYFGLDHFTQQSFSKLFGYINLGLSLPVFFFSAQDYFKAAYKATRSRYNGIDVPLALGILTMFMRSCYEVLSGSGPGWFDTLAGLVFFLLIGKWFQQKTFDTLSFDRDYKSYFPIAVSILKESRELSVPLTSLSIGDRILVRNNEIIPADAILLKGEGNIDFSFVTGESNPVSKGLGEIVHAGGRQRGGILELEVCKKVLQSYLTQLWNNEAFTKNQTSEIESFQQTVSKYFTIILLVIAFGSACWWLLFNPALATNAFTAVLIIACPCALALSSPFALGTAMRVLGRSQFYLKSPMVLEQMAHIDTIVFDKTGTITQASGTQVTFVGESLTICQQQWIRSVVEGSIHPLSQKIKQFLPSHGKLQVDSFKEETGKGISASVNSHQLKLGSAHFVTGGSSTDKGSSKAATVFVSIDGLVKGYFEIAQVYRKGLPLVLQKLQQYFQTYLLSGDNDNEKKQLSTYFTNADQLLFEQSPSEKLEFIEKLQQAGHKVMMVGDGLNDAGALKAADIGISVAENTSHFSPASDVIMDASVFEKLPSIFAYSKNTLRVIHISFIISLAYNIVGLSFAVQGTLSPLVAAILMPLSSITVIAFTTFSTLLLAKQNQLS